MINYSLFVAIIVSLTLSIILLILVLRLYRDVRILNRKYDSLIRSLNSKAIKSYLKSIEERKKRKVRKRYLIFEVIHEGNVKELNTSFLNKLIKDCYRELFGSLDISLSGIALVNYDNKIRKGIIRYRSGYRAKLLLTLALAQYKERIILRPIRTTGTLRKALTYLK